MQCGLCNTAITGQFLEAMGKKIHPDCFVCGKCKKAIGASKFAVDADKPYHADCLALLRGDVCAKCSKPVTNSLTVLDKKFHPECFVCGGCKKPMEGGQVSLKDNTPYHPGCLPAAPAGPSSPAAPATLCSGCQKPIMPGTPIINAINDKPWHPDCFKCAKCNLPIKEASFKIDGPRAYHAKCSAGPERICPGCKKPITDKKVLEALDAMWHPACFKCCVCNKPIEGGSYKSQEGMPVHPDCKEDMYEITETFYTSKEPGAKAVTVTRMVKASELEAAKASQEVPTAAAAAAASSPKAKAAVKAPAKAASPTAKVSSPRAKLASSPVKPAAPKAAPGSPRSAASPTKPAAKPVTAKPATAKPVTAKLAVKPKAAVK